MQVPEDRHAAHDAIGEHGCTSTPIAGHRRPLPRGALRGIPATARRTVGMAITPLRQAIQLLDRGMAARDVEEPLVVAVRPIVAAQPTPGQAHHAPGHDQDADADRGHDGQLPVAGARHQRPGYDYRRRGAEFVRRLSDPPDVTAGGPHRVE